MKNGDKGIQYITGTVKNQRMNTTTTKQNPQYARTGTGKPKAKN